MKAIREEREADEKSLFFRPHTSKVKYTFINAGLSKDSSMRAILHESKELFFWNPSTKASRHLRA